MVLVLPYHPLKYSMLVHQSNTTICYNHLASNNSSLQARSFRLSMHVQICFLYRIHSDMYNPQGSLACGMALPATGLLWWYKFYSNILDDLNGRSITAILKNPNTGNFPNSRKRHPRPFWKRFLGSPNSQQLYHLALSQSIFGRMKKKQDNLTLSYRSILCRNG